MRQLRVLFVIRFLHFCLWPYTAEQFFSPAHLLSLSGVKRSLRAEWFLGGGERERKKKDKKGRDALT